MPRMGSRLRSQEGAIQGQLSGEDEVSLVQTRAGHDSTNMKEIVPSVMLFVPSVEGISHAEAEFTSDEDLCTGVDLLTETLARMLDGALDSATANGIR